MSGKPRADSPCGTPGTVYETEIDDSEIVMRMKLPLPVLAALTEAERSKLVGDLHGGIIPAMEWVFSRTWAEFFAGKLLPLASDERLPERHSDLFRRKVTAGDAFSGRASVYSSQGSPERGGGAR
jgi:hypothetical protein